MSDFLTCIANGEGEKKLTPEQAVHAREIYTEFRRQHEAGGSADVDGDAARSTFDQLEIEAAERKRRLRIQSEVSARIVEDMANYRTISGESSPGDAMMAHFFDDHAGSGIQNVEMRERAIKGYAHAPLAEAILKFQRNLMGRTRNIALLRDVVREAFGTNTGNAKAKEFASAWSESAERLRKMYNRAGGAIGTRSDWGLPTRHKIENIRQAGFDRWRDFIVPLLDPARMIDANTGKTFTPEAMDRALRSMYDAITSRGWSRREASRAPSAGSAATRHGKERFLAFKDADSWLAYQDAFGEGDPFHTMMHHIDHLTKDVAAMQIFGPNPSATIRWMGDLVKKHANSGAEGADPKVQMKRERRADAQIKKSNTMWKHYTGEINDPANVTVANFAAGTRAGLTGTLLGGTTLVAVPTDIASQTAARRFAGMKQTGIIRDLIKLMNPADASDRTIAIRSGLVAEHAAQIGLGASRYTGENELHGKMGQYADSALRLTGLSQATQAARWSMGMEWMGHLADRAGKTFDELEPGTQRILTRHGLKEDWDYIRAAPMGAVPEERLITVDAVARTPGLSTPAAEDLALRYSAAIQSEMEYSTPTGTLRAKATLSPGEAGTIMGEIGRSAGMFKSFPVLVTHLHSRRMWSLIQDEGLGVGVRYITALVTSTTMAGAMAMQLGEIRKGRDPLDMTDPKFWAGAMLKGGGLGIWADFVGGMVAEDYGRDPRAAVAGPVAGLIFDVGRLTFGNAGEIARGEDPRIGRDLVRALKGYTPFSRTWWAQTAIERVFFDNLQTMVDPEAHRDFRNKIRRAERERGQGYYWAPGEMTPDRAPDMEAAVGG